MKLSNYITKLNRILKENGDLKVIYCTYENYGYKKVSLGPTAGYYLKKDNVLFEVEEFEELEKNYPEMILTVNAICIN